MAPKNEKSIMVTARIPPGWVTILDEIANREHEETGADITRSSVITRGIYKEIKEKTGKTCPKCSYLGIATANYCQNCGAHLPDVDLSEIRKTMEDLKLTPEELKCALAHLKDKPD